MMTVVEFNKRFSILNGRGNTFAARDRTTGEVNHVKRFGPDDYRAMPVKKQVELIGSVRDAENDN